MTKEEFEELSFKFKQLIGLVNKDLRELKLSLDEALKKNNVTLKEFNEMGMDYISKSNSIERVRFVSYRNFESIENRQQPRQEIEIVNKSNQLFTQVDEVQADQLQDIIKNYPVIMEMVNRFKQNQEKVLEAGIIIELPFDDDKQINKSFRLNGVIAKQWEEFCQEHKQFTVKDLASMALKEYMAKHK